MGSPERMGRVDRTLVVQAQEGDREAFSLLAGASVDRLYAIARVVLRDADRAEDAVQEALVRCWRDLPSLRDPGAFDAWLRRILMHTITNEFRRGRRHEANVRVIDARAVHRRRDVDDGGSRRDRARVPAAVRRASRGPRPAASPGAVRAGGGRCHRRPGGDRQVATPLRDRGTPGGARRR